MKIEYKYSVEIQEFREECDKARAAIIQNCLKNVDKFDNESINRAKIQAVDLCRDINDIEMKIVNAAECDIVITPEGDGEIVEVK